jgi:hypothetical protein
VAAAPAYSISGYANSAFAGLNDFARGGLVLTSFPRAMLIMAGAFGFWRAGLISDTLFGAGVALDFLLKLHCC